VADEQKQQRVDPEMSVWDHLEELRWVVVRAVIGIAVGMVICAIFGDWILEDVILEPARKYAPKFQFITTEIYGQLELYMQIIIWGGVILSFPYTIIQIWKFIEPGLYSHEKKYVKTITFYTVFSFIVGMVFAYYVMLPMTLQFAADFGTQLIKIMPDVHKYLSVFLMTIIISGIVFELPLVSYFLGRLGILTPPFMRHYRRHTIVVLLFLAAILSPGGNPLLQLILFIPLWALFELSIFASMLAQRHRRQKETANNQ
jgi:sec-independent protein translocase protein TatC